MIRTAEELHQLLWFNKVACGSVCSGLLAGTSSFEKNKQDITNPELLLEILIGLIQLY